MICLANRVLVPLDSIEIFHPSRDEPIVEVERVVRDRALGPARGVAALRENRVERAVLPLVVVRAEPVEGSEGTDVVLGFVEDRGERLIETSVLEESRESSVDHGRYPIGVGVCCQREGESALSSRAPAVASGEPVLASPVIFVLGFVGGVGEALARIEPDQVRDGIAVGVHRGDRLARSGGEIADGGGEGGMIERDIGNRQRVSALQDAGRSREEGGGANGSGQIRHFRFSEGEGFGRTLAGQFRRAIEHRSKVRGPVNRSQCDCG